MKKRLNSLLTALALCLFPALAGAQSAETADPNFYIYLCFEGKAFYGTTEQNLAYDITNKAFLDTNTGFMFLMESLSDNADASIRGYYYLRLIQPNGQPYNIWGRPGYLNSQPVNKWCSFILGLNNQNGEDIRNGAVWSIEYTEGMGFSLKNIGTGKYLHDASPAKYDTPAYFSFCSLSSTNAVENVMATNAQDNIYTLQGVKVGTTGQWNRMRRGLYIVNGKIIRK
jgi:hypothetical protein